MPSSVRSTGFPPLAFLLAALGGCHTPAPVPPTPAMPAPVAPLPAAAASPTSAAAPKPTLLDEQRRLAALFKGTPVVFAMQSSGSLRVDVPLRFCFERGRTAVRPALAAVLDRVGQSQRDADSRIRISATADALRPRAAASAAPSAPRAPVVARAALAARRVESVRDRLVAQGIGIDRIAVVASDAAGVRLLVRDSPAP